MRSGVVRALSGLDAHPVENPAYPGTPDIECCCGWIECKWRRSWPSRADTIVEVDHYTPQQRNWAIARRKVGGNVWLLLQVRREWLLFEGIVATILIDKATREQLYNGCFSYWKSGLNVEQFVRVIRKGLPR